MNEAQRKHDEKIFAFYLAPAVLKQWPGMPPDQLVNKVAQYAEALAKRFGDAP